MNIVNIVGKIIRIRKTEKVCYATLLCKSSADDAEFIPITIFQTDFFNKYFHENKWVGIRGHIHINKHNNEYSTEIIVDDLFFIGDKTDNVEIMEDIPAIFNN